MDWKCGNAKKCGIELLRIMSCTDFISISMLILILCPYSVNIVFSVHFDLVKDQRVTQIMNVEDYHQKDIQSTDSKNHSKNRNIAVMDLKRNLNQYHVIQLVHMPMLHPIHQQLKSNNPLISMHPNLMIVIMNLVRHLYGILVMVRLK